MQRIEEGLKYAYDKIVYATKDLDSFEENDLMFGIPALLTFLIKYRKLHDYPKHDKDIKRILVYISNSCKKNKKHGFFNGTSGVVFSLLCIYKLTQDHSYIWLALKIAYTFREYLSVKKDLNEGVAGTLLGLLHLHSVTKKEWLIEDINIYVNYLVDHLVIREKGVTCKKFSYRNKNFHDPQHNIGMCYIFFELGYYLNNQTFLTLADELFTYYNTQNFFAPPQTYQRQPSIFADKNLVYALACHRGFNLTGKESYLKRINYLDKNLAENSLQKNNNIRENIQKYFIYDLLNNKKKNPYFENIIKLFGNSLSVGDEVAIGNILINNIRQQDSKYLSLLYAKKSTQVKLNSAFKNILNISYNELRVRIIKNSSLVIYSILQKHFQTNALNSDSFFLISELFSYIKQIDMTNKEKQSLVEELARLEKSESHNLGLKYNTKKKSSSSAYLLFSLSFRDILNEKFVLSSLFELRISVTREKNSSHEENEYILFDKDEGKEYPINKLSYDIFQFFLETRKVNDIILHVFNKYDRYEFDTIQMRNILEEHIISAIRANILVSND